ncbi:unnamed protein product [Lampetra fluviatilis]
MEVIVLRWGISGTHRASFFGFDFGFVTPGFTWRGGGEGHRRAEEQRAPRGASGLVARAKNGNRHGGTRLRLVTAVENPRL